jgi:uncharacterized protein (DUF58 family)
MILRRQFPTFERLYHWWNVRFTPGGKVISLLVLYSIPAILSFDDAMPFVGLCAVTVLLLTWLLGRVFRPRIDPELRTPDFATVDQAFIATVQVHNPSKQAALDLVVRVADRNPDWIIDQDMVPFSLAPQETASQRVAITSRQRGLVTIPRADMLTVFPMNLIRRHVAKLDSTEVTVLPKVLPLEIGAEDGMAELLGIEQRLLATAGMGFDYIGSREYREGPVRRWDYASWARLGQPVVREFSEEADRQVAILIDTRTQRTWGAAARTAFENFISCAFSVIEHLLSEEIEIAVCIVGDAVSSDLARAGNYGHKRIRKLISTAKPSRVSDSGTDTKSLTDHTDGPVLVFVPAWDELREELIKDLSRSHSCVRPVVFRSNTDQPLPTGLLSVSLSEKGIQLG